MSELALEKVRQRFGEAVLETSSEHGDDTVVIDRAAIVELSRFLKEDDELRFNMLVDLFGVDRSRLPQRRERFEVVYHFYSVAEKRHRLRVRVPVPEDDPSVPSITAVWPGANWYERECWDMFGIRFEGHPNLKRILLYEEFEGHPLRKDYERTRRQPRIGVPH